MKIAFITPGFVPVPAVKGGAIERLMTYLIEQNEDANEFDIDLYTVDHPKLTNIKFKNTKINKIKLNKIEEIHNRLFNHFFWRFNIEKSFNQYGRKTLKKLLKNKYDYILIENNMYIYKNIYSKIIKKYPNTKFIFHLHNDIGKVDKPNSLCKYILNTATTVLTCSEYLKNRLESICKTNNVKVLYNVIDFSNMNYNEEERKKLRKQYDIENNFVYGYIGRISKEKGVLELIRAYKKVVKNNNNVKLMIIGDTLFNNSKNKYCMDIEKEISDIKDSIILVGSIKNELINNYMSAVDALVIPTICEEAFGIVAVEGLACERPIVATKSGGMLEILNDKNSLLIDKSNIVSNLEEALINVLENKDEYTKKSKVGKSILINNDNFHCKYYLKNFCNLIKKGM